ncbi:tetratricopeptide repeat protein [Sphingosinicella sp. CPCC 101087]|uniref:tetratricopeptide repeat protein n=1 Tax=Sphingosinicella sp. CPCC 101087 TaxID=2497754 RepID=UPI00101CC691|nr:tetratricopeptide repeat protein [Sphingosinicella sp. CPCC 101087]
MTGWILMLVLALATGAGLWRFVRRDKGAVQFLGAALLLALAGYAWQGRPALEGRPKPPPQRQQIPDSAFAETREDMLGRFDRAWYWLNMSEGFARRGDTQGAAQVISAGLRDSPNDPDLWAGLGSALVTHADGMMTPAAELAFRRARAIAPEHPAPRFYYGLALAQGGQFDQAEQIWRELLSQAPPDADYRRIIEERLAALQQARSMGQIPPAATP